MVAQGTDNMIARHVARDSNAVRPDLPSTLEWRPGRACDGVPIEKRRDGGTRYWCRAIGPMPQQRAARRQAKCSRRRWCSIRAEEIQTLDLGKYLGGVALWAQSGRLRYDAASDGQRHPHPRPSKAGVRKGDGLQFPSRSTGWERLPDKGTSSTRSTRSITWSARFSDSRCVTSPAPIVVGRTWTRIGSAFIRTAGISAPAAGSTSTTNQGDRQSDRGYPGGLRLRGTQGSDRPRRTWTSSSRSTPVAFRSGARTRRSCGRQPKHEEEGIHVHAFLEGHDRTGAGRDVPRGHHRRHQARPLHGPGLDGTKVMPSLKGRVRSIDCPHCGQPGFDLGEAAYALPDAYLLGVRVPVPDPGGRETWWPTRFQRSSAQLAKTAPRRPQQQQLDLLPETL